MGTDPVRLDATGATGHVPVLAWLPDATAPPPVVLLGHGGSGTKASPRHLRLGARFARLGTAAVAIDSPFHGERVAEPMTAAEYQCQMVQLGPERVFHDMVQDWMAALDALGTRVDQQRCAYLGLSLGARLGLPVAAHLGPRLRCAVLGKFGLSQSDQFPAGLASSDLHRAAARDITAPVLMPVQRDDELFSLSGSVALFDAFGSTDKTLLVRPGTHGASHADDERTWSEFLQRHLSR